jgi:hypothetical protein
MTSTIDSSWITSAALPKSQLITQLDRAASEITALQAHHFGTSAPSSPQAGYIWIDSDTPSASVWEVKVYTGSVWLVMGYVDSTQSIFYPAHGKAVVKRHTLSATAELIIPLNNLGTYADGGTCLGVTLNIRRLVPSTAAQLRLLVSTDGGSNYLGAASYTALGMSVTTGTVAGYQDISGSNIILSGSTNIGTTQPYSGNIVVNYGTASLPTTVQGNYRAVTATPNETAGQCYGRTLINGVPTHLKLLLNSGTMTGEVDVTYHTNDL